MPDELLVTLRHKRASSASSIIVEAKLAADAVEGEVLIG
jgi:hypothetical protein